jgi:hypothetical protein
VIIRAAMIGKISIGAIGVPCGDVVANEAAMMNARTIAGPTNGLGRPRVGGPFWGLGRSADRRWAVGM